MKKNQTCADAFLKCCIDAERLRQRKMQEDSQKGLGRSELELKYTHLNNLNLVTMEYEGI